MYRVDKMVKGQWIIWGRYCTSGEANDAIRYLQSNGFKARICIF